MQKHTESFKFGNLHQVECCAIIVSFCNRMAKRRGQQNFLILVWQRMFWAFIFMFYSTWWQLTLCLNYDKFCDTAPLMVGQFCLFQPTNPWTGCSWRRSGCAWLRTRYSNRCITYSTDYHEWLTLESWFHY